MKTAQKNPRSRGAVRSANPVAGRWGLALAMLVAAGSVAGSAGGRPAPEAVAHVDATAFRQVGTVDPRFQSYTVEMLEVMGGSFWKPYGKSEAATGAGKPAGPFEYRPPIDLANPRLRTLAKALGPAYVRVSGTWANTAYFADGDAAVPPPPGFKGVLTRRQWRGVIDFVRAVDGGLVTSFAIGDGVRDAGGVWMPDMAQRWVDYTHAIGGSIAAAEFMNEPSMAGISGAPKGYTAADFGRDFRRFVAFARKAAPEMKILGPGSASETAQPWGMPQVPGSLATASLLEAMGSGGLDAFSYHHYGAASQRCASAKMPQTSEAEALSDEWLARTGLTRDFYAALRDRYAPGTPIWMTEGADAACGGNPWGGQFIDSFRYLDQLGRLARAGVQVSFHNTLAAGSYSLLDPEGLTPKANYWAALLWHKLMGPSVLDVGVPPGMGLHLYAHCLPQQSGGVALLVINNGAHEARLMVRQPSDRYTLSAPEPGNASAKLNGVLLALGSGDALPALQAVRSPAGMTAFAPDTITFLAIPGAANVACRVTSGSSPSARPQVTRP